MKRAISTACQDVFEQKVRYLWLMNILKLLSINLFLLQLSCTQSFAESPVGLIIDKTRFKADSFGVAKSTELATSDAQHARELADQALIKLNLAHYSDAEVCSEKAELEARKFFSTSTGEDSSKISFSYILIVRGKVLTEVGHYAKAEKVLDEALNLLGNEAVVNDQDSLLRLRKQQALLAQAQLYKMLQNRADGLKAATKISENFRGSLNPKTDKVVSLNIANGLYYSGYFHRCSRQFKQAISSCDEGLRVGAEALKLYPNDLELLTAMSGLAFERAFSFFQDEPSTETSESIALALSSCDKALVTSPEFSEFLELKADTLFIKGNFENGERNYTLAFNCFRQAIECDQKSLALTPNRIEALIRKSRDLQALAMMGDQANDKSIAVHSREEALSSSERALKLIPKSLPVLFRHADCLKDLAEANLKAGEKERALETCIKAVSIYDEILAVSSIAYASWAKGSALYIGANCSFFPDFEMLERAVSCFNQALNMTASPSFYVSKGRALTELSRFSTLSKEHLNQSKLYAADALISFKEAIKLDPKCKDSVLKDIKTAETLIHGKASNEARVKQIQSDIKRSLQRY